MSLTTRLSLFFLAALAIVLVGFSAALYLLAREYLGRQVDERLSAALDALETAVDREPDGLEWDVHDKQLPVGQDAGPEGVRWEVRGDKDVRLDRSANWSKIDPEVPAQDGQMWQWSRRQLRAARPAATTPPEQPRRHSQLVLRAGVSLEPMRTTLQRLLLALAGLSVGVWLTAALAGRVVCKRALAPLTRMANAARGMGAADLSQRLPGPAMADELGDLQQAFNDLLDRLQEAFERQRRFTGDASHQLRTPLTAMLGHVEVALRRDRPADEYRGALTQVQLQAEYLRRIVEALLFLARADADAELSRLEPVDLAAWLPRHLEGWAQHPRAADLHCDAAEAAVVRGQPVLLGQLLDNLLDNAFKYSEPESPVRVVVRLAGAVATVAVEDHGPGIDPADLPHIFEPFYRSPDARRQGKGGVGLGLATAQRIAHTLGGTLIAESPPGGGSRFVLQLPLAESGGL